jgi:hypothetical protein
MRNGSPIASTHWPSSAGRRNSADRRGNPQRHVGQRHQHAAVAHPAGVQMLAIDPDAQPHATVGVSPDVERAVMGGKTFCYRERLEAGRHGIVGRDR